MFARNQENIKKIEFLHNTSGLDYELIDFGEGRKLERFGDHYLDRPQTEAKGNKVLPQQWETADHFFWEERGKIGEWKDLRNKNRLWEIQYKDQKFSYKFKLELSNYKHIGLFPEQVANWQYIQQKVNALPSCNFLNLFAYTSAASLIAAKNGAAVTNVEALKQLSQWSKENADLNSIENIRWITEDARKFVERAVRRGEKYQGILLDPPAFGYGSKGKRWIIEKDLPELLTNIKKILDPKGSFLIINTYSPKMPMSLLDEILKKEGLIFSNVEYLELGLESTSKKQIALGNLLRSSSF